MLHVDELRRSTLELAGKILDTVVAPTSHPVLFGLVLLHPEPLHGEGSEVLFRAFSLSQRERAKGEGKLRKVS